MRKFLLGLWLFAMGITLSFATKALSCAYFYDWAAFRINMVLAVTISTLAMIPLIAVVHGYRKDLDVIQEYRRACSTGRDVDSDILRGMCRIMGVPVPVPQVVMAQTPKVPETEGAGR